MVPLKVKNRACLLWIGFVLFSCVKETNTESHPEHMTVIKEDKKGNKESEISYSKDSLKDGTSRFYFKNGRIEREIEYKKGLMDGAYRRYYYSFKPEKTNKESHLECKVRYREGKQHGEAIWYYESGQIKSRERWVNGKTFGDAYYFYPNGKMRRYKCYDFEQHLRYLINYDSTGRKVDEEGTVLGQVDPDFHLDAVPIKQKVECKISVCTPPELEGKIFYYKIPKNHKKMKVKELDIVSNVAIATDTFEARGSYAMLIVGKLRTLDNQVYKTDSIKIDVNVR
jgi:antitoxin component YwqK of YwqJK toxin-antitoxin module